MTSQGHLPAQFARACERGNYGLAVALAAELKPLSLRAALDLLPLIAEHEPTKFEAAAARWHARWLLENPRANLLRSGIVYAALAALRERSTRDEGRRLLRGLL